MSEKISESKPAPKASVFPVKRLRDDCVRLFGVTQGTFDGAMHGQSGDMSVNDAKQRISTWLKTPIKTITRGEK